MCKLSHLATECNNEKIRKIADGILWNLELDYNKGRQTLEVKDENTFDIMISYSHKEKVLYKQIYDGLVNSGYRVWIDFDQMHGNAKGAMAHAIKQSKTVIICMSEHYQKRNYCRVEAQYTFQ